jgi:hypothetical protein
MRQVNYKDEIYDVIDIVHIRGTYHVVISNGKDVTYINKIGDKYYPPIKNLKAADKNNKFLEYLRKQHIMQCLINYIKDNNLYNNIKEVIEAFKEYLKTTFVETFLYWPYMTDSEFETQMDVVKTDVEAFLNGKLINILINNNVRTIKVEDMVANESKEIK